MKPVYQIFINGTDVTANLQGRITSITLEDTAGFNNDKLDIVVECLPAISIPRRGARAQFYLGYKAEPNMPVTVPLTYMGEFEFDESEVQKSKSAGRTLTLRFHALATGGMWKETYNRSYDAQPLSEIISFIAKEHGLTAVIDPSFYQVTTAYMVQKNEADQSFLSALGLRYGANFKISNKELIFARVGTVQALADTVKEDQTSAWRWLNQSTSNYGAVVASTYDPDTKTYKYATKIVRTNEGEAERKENARLTLPMQYPTIEEAQAAADGRAAALEVQGHTFSFELHKGNPLLKAEMMIKAEGFYDVAQGVQMPNYWHLTQVTHRLTKKGGYVTSGECDRPAIAATLLGPNASAAERKAANDAASKTIRALEQGAKADNKRDLAEKKKAITNLKKNL